MARGMEGIERKVSQISQVEASIQIFFFRESEGLREGPWKGREWAQRVERARRVEEAASESLEEVYSPTETKASSALRACSLRRRCGCTVTTPERFAKPSAVAATTPFTTAASSIPIVFAIARSTRGLIEGERRKKKVPEDTFPEHLVQRVLLMRDDPPQ